MSFLRLPILPTNFDDCYVVDCRIYKPGELTDGGEKSVHVGYPSGTQLFLWIDPRYVTAIRPSGMNAEGKPIPGCYVHIGNTAHFCIIPADRVAALIEEGSEK